MGIGSGGADGGCDREKIGNGFGKIGGGMKKDGEEWLWYHGETSVKHFCICMFCMSEVILVFFRREILYCILLKGLKPHLPSIENEKQRVC